ncbi:hypothetical protein QTP70_019270, partial [Hemibagrus guttatus]
MMLAYKAKNGPVPSYLKALITPHTAPRFLGSTRTARLVPPSLRVKEAKREQFKVPCPAAVSTYNQHMGSVDFLDLLIALYRTNIRSKKWYHRLVFHLIDMAE